MHFCLTGQYTPRALKAILENPATNRQEAARKLIEAAGGKLVSMYSVAADGPGVLVIFDVPDPTAAPAISGLTVTAGTLQNVKLVRLFTQDEIKQVRQNAAKAGGGYFAGDPHEIVVAPCLGADSGLLGALAVAQQAEAAA